VNDADEPLSQRAVQQEVDMGSLLCAKVQRGGPQFQNRRDVRQTGEFPSQPISFFYTHRSPILPTSRQFKNGASIPDKSEDTARKSAAMDFTSPPSTTGFQARRAAFRAGPCHRSTIAAKASGPMSAHSKAPAGAPQGHLQVLRCTARE